MENNNEKLKISNSENSSFFEQKVSSSNGNEGYPKLRFKDFNNDWKEHHLEDIVKNFEYGMNAAAVDYDGTNKYIRITDIDENSHRYINSSPVSPSGILENKYKVMPNDILFARTGASVGKTYLYDLNDGLLYFAGFLIRANISISNNSYFIFCQTH